MGASQRRKGAVYEREVCEQINAALGLTGDAAIGRNLGQARDGGNDITLPIPGYERGKYRIEAKRRQQLSTLYKWLSQAQASCDLTAADCPVVVTRADGKPSIAIIRLDALLRLLRAERG